MSVLIKAGAAAALVRPASAPASPHDDLVKTLRQRVADLEQTLDERDDALRRAGPARDAAYEEGRDVGHKAGAEAAGELQHERLERLEAGLAAAQDAFMGQLRETDRLAAALAHDCLEILFGTGGERAKIVGDLIREQLKEIDAATLIAVEVSTGDFPDVAAREALRRRIAGDRIEIVALPELASGACTMTLRLGRVELGIDQQWSALATTLRQFAQGDEPA